MKFVCFTFLLTTNLFTSTSVIIETSTDTSHHTPSILFFFALFLNIFFPPQHHCFLASNSYFIQTDECCRQLFTADSLAHVDGAVIMQRRKVPVAPAAHLPVTVRPLRRAHGLTVCLRQPGRVRGSV